MINNIYSYITYKNDNKSKWYIQPIITNEVLFILFKPSLKYVLTPPQPSALARSFPVPNGSTPTGNDTALAIWSKMDSTHPTVPSPPHANTRRFGTFLYSSSPILGPPRLRSNTCLGFKCHWNFCSSFIPWLPPDFGFINIITGLTFTVGIGLITNSLSSLSGCKTISIL